MTRPNISVNGTLTPLHGLRRVPQALGCMSTSHLGKNHKRRSLARSMSLCRRRAQQAFQLFTARFGHWWPRDYSYSVRYSPASSRIRRSPWSELRNFEPELLELVIIRRFDGADTWKLLD